VTYSATGAAVATHLWRYISVMPLPFTSTSTTTTSTTTIGMAMGGEILILSSLKRNVFKRGLKPD